MSRRPRVRRRCGRGGRGCSNVWKDGVNCVSGFDGGLGGGLIWGIICYFPGFRKVVFSTPPFFLKSEVFFVLPCRYFQGPLQGRD